MARTRLDMPPDVRPNEPQGTGRGARGSSRASWWRNRRAASWSRRVLALSGAVAVGLLGTWYLAMLSARTYAGNSDGATVILEGRAISAGHLLLSGWSMTVESFWTIDALVYAAAVELVGVRPALLHAVPAVLVVALMGLGIWLAGRHRRLPGALAGAATVIAVLGLPSATLSYMMLQGPWHVGTALWCLLAFAALHYRRPVVALVASSLLLAAGLLGDAMTVSIGLLPVLVWGVVEIIGGRWRSTGWRGLCAPIAAGLVAFGARSAAVALGTFSLVNRNLPVRLTQLRWNLHHLAGIGGALMGYGSLPIGVAPGSSLFQEVRLGVAVVIVACVLWALASLLASPFRRRSAAVASRSLDRLLVLATLADLGTFVVGSPTGNANYERYLLPGIVFATVLAARVIARSVDRLSSWRLQWPVVVAGVAVLALLGTDVAGTAERPIAPHPASALAHFLEGHGFRRGIGDYWSSSLVTVESDDRVVVRPVAATPTGTIVRFNRQSAAGWYANTPFQFFVYDTSRPWRGVDETSARKTFGTPVNTYTVGTYRILVWHRQIRISPALPPPPPPVRFFFHL